MHGRVRQKELEQGWNKSTVGTYNFILTNANKRAGRFQASSSLEFG
jgi:hypothetical protein